MRHGRVRWLMVFTVALTVFAGSSVAVAQDASGDAFCALLKPKEVRQILGTKVEVAPGDSSCTWGAARKGELIAATADWSSLSVAEHKEAWPDGADVTIGGHAAYYSPGLFVNELLVKLDAGVLHLAVTGYEGDVEAALTELGELAVQRSGSLPPAAQPAAAPSMDADLGLESLFPATLGGQPLEVMSLAGEDVILVPEDRAAMGEALATLGKTFDELTGAYAFSPAGVIAAFRVAGVDATATLVPIVGVLAGSDVELTPVEVAGKDVILVGSDPAYHAYAAGDVLWLVQAQDPGLTEILTALP